MNLWHWWFTAWILLTPFIPDTFDALTKPKPKKVHYREAK